MLPPCDRLDQIPSLIEQQAYFVLHAPRQTGKTTLITTLAKSLTQQGRYTAIVLTVEEGAPFGNDIAAAEKAIVKSWEEQAQDLLPQELWPRFSVESLTAGQAIRTSLREWAKTCPRPLIIFIDEIDALQGETLLSILRQLRSGYDKRPNNFPQSVALVGLRDVRDYKITSGSTERLHTSSPFNIKVESLTLRNFHCQEVDQLYAQHTEETGQTFSPDAIARAYELTQGQPWLVNAIARQAVQTLQRDRTKAITVDIINQAKEILIQRRDTHIDSLAERLREDRVKAIIQPILSGQELGDIPNDDVEFLIDIGLCRIDETGNLAIANPIYREVLPRTLAFTTTISLGQITPTWLDADGTLNPDELLKAFLRFWKQNGQPLLKGVAYHEIAPHIVLMAFLHRVVNGSGSVEREYAIGSDRMDLCLRYDNVTLGMELKVWRDHRPDPLEAGIKQLDRYLSGLSLQAGWLVIFDQRSAQVPIHERISTIIQTSPQGRTVTVIRA